MKKLSMRKLLFLLVGVMAVPMAVIIIFTIYSDTQINIENAKMTAKRLSVLSASDVIRVVESNKNLLMQMEKRPQIKVANMDLCDHILWEFKELFPKSANMTVVDMDGIAVCSAVPQPNGKPVDVSKAPWFQKFLKRKDFVVSDPFFGPITGRWVTVLAYPIRDDGNKLVGMLGLPLDLSFYQPNLSAVSLTDNTTFGIVTSKGVHVWRNVDTEDFVGKNGKETPAVQQMLSVKNGEFTGKGIDGVERLYSVTEIKELNWYAYAGVPLKPLYDKAKSEVFNDVLIALAGITFLIGFAFFVARRIEKPIGELLHVVEEVKNGNLNVRANITTGVSEIIEVAKEFNTMLDVRLQSEKMAKINEELFQTLFQVVPMPLAYVDKEGIIKYANRTFTGVFGYTLEDIPTLQTWLEKAYPDEDYRDKVSKKWQNDVEKAAKLNLPVEPFEYNVTCKKGDVKVIEISGISINEDFIATFFDVTARKEDQDKLEKLNKNLQEAVDMETNRRVAKEQLLIQQSKMAQMGEMLTMISHHWRQPLNIIGLAVQNLQDAFVYGELTEKEMDEGAEIVKKYLTRLSATLITLSSLVTHNKDEKIFNVSDSTTSLCKLISAELESLFVSFMIEVDDELYIKGVPAFYTQIVTHLLKNAEEAVTAQPTNRRKISVRLFRDSSEKVILEIEDSGEGIKEEVIPRLFEPFFTTKSIANKTGLGLYIVKMLVEQQFNGEIEFVNGDNQGAVFRVKFPFIKEKII